MSKDQDYLQFMTDKTSVDENVIKEFTNESEFNAVSISLFKEYLSLIVPIASIRRYQDGLDPIPFRSPEAALIGNLVRYWKISRAMLDEFAKGREEILHIHFRCLAETYVNIKYFLEKNDETTLNHYIKHSLRQEKKLLELIRNNIKHSNKIKPIEERMIASIKRSIEMSGFKEDKIKNSSKWESKLKSRINDLMDPGLYILLYGNTSHAIHGNWQDLINFHLIKSEEGFEPNIEFRQPNCKTLNTVNMISCELLSEYGTAILPQSNRKEELLVALKDIMKRTFKLRCLHEEYYSNKYN